MIHVSRSYETDLGPESATAEEVLISAWDWGITIRWKSAEDGRTPCLYVDVCLAGRWFSLVERKPKYEE